MVEEEGAGTPLLLIHGLGMSSALWRNQVPVFAQHSRTVAVDLRGFGRSSKPGHPGAYAIDVLAEDMVAVMQRLGLAGCHVLGTSMGGFVAQAIAIAHPELCRSLILCHTNARTPSVFHAGDLQRPAATGAAVRGVGAARNVFVNTAHEPAKGQRAVGAKRAPDHGAVPATWDLSLCATAKT